MKMLPRVLIGETWYFIDQRLKQFRNVDDPHDFEDANEELIESFWS